MYININHECFIPFCNLFFAGLEKLLIPDRVHVKPKSAVFVDLWAGNYNTVAVTDQVYIV